MQLRRQSPASCRQRQEAGDRRRTRDPVQTADRTLATAVPSPRGERLALGRYRLVRRLGAGAFGVVWLAHDEQLGRVVAVKRIELHDDQVAARAEREAQAAARLQHPGIVALFEAARDNDAIHLVSELVRGRTLADLVEDGALSDRDVMRIGACLCAALEHAHARGVVHRDVKPANVIVPEHPGSEQEIAKLTDFGVAAIAGDDALTRTGDVVGTLAYMAPEQAEGRQAGGEADLYSLALVLYEALSGVNPVRAGGAAATARRLGTRLPPLRRMRREPPAEACAAIDRALLPRPGDRGTLAELREALEDATGVAGRMAGAITPTHPGGRSELPRDPAHGPDPVGGPGPAGRRVVSALASAALAAAALTALPGPDAPTAQGALAIATGTGLAALLLPRVAWLLAVPALIAWLALAGLPGVAVLVAAAVLPVMLLLPGNGTLWPAPAGAPLLGFAGLALAWPALAGQARGLAQRAALGAVGLWWLALAEAIAAPQLLLGDVPGLAARAAWEPSAERAVTGVLVPIATSGVLVIALLWGAMACALPLVARGRRPTLDVVAVTCWAAGLAAATAALAAGLQWSGGAPEPRGLVLGTLAAGAVALIGGAARPRGVGGEAGH